MNDKPVPAKAIEMLEVFYPGEDLHLVKISIEGEPKKLIGDFIAGNDPERPKLISDWVNSSNQHNFYFPVNPVAGFIGKPKGKKKHVTEVRWLHVDVDPDPKFDLKQEQVRILRLLTTDLPKGVPHPTVIIFSGGGYQAFWRLSNPIPVNGDQDVWEDIERYTKRLEAVFGGDNCHNIDRIMRVAGTMNRPDEKKVKKGREPALAAMIHHNPAAIYDLADFKPAERVQKAGQPLGTTRDQNYTPPVSGPQKFESLDFLRDKYKVDDITLVAISQGRDENNPKEKDDSRSAWVFHICCHLVRKRVPDDVIFSLLMDKDWGISESVLEMGASAERYAIRQISRARIASVPPEIAALNERYALMTGMSPVKVVSFKTVQNKFGSREQIVYQSPTDVGLVTAPEKMWVPAKKRDQDGNPILLLRYAWDEWTESPFRRSFRQVVFRPEEGPVVDGDDLNLWRGWAVEEKRGKWPLMRRHIHDIICDGNSEHFEWLIKWMAWCYQNPGDVAGVGVVLIGGQGIGKGAFVNAFLAPFGQHKMQTASPSQVIGRFNSQLEDCCMVFLDEAFAPSKDNLAAVGRIKTLITESELPIEGKGRDVYNARNCLKFILASNNEHAVNVDMDDRRWLALEVCNKHANDKTYFGPLHAEMEEGGIAAMFCGLKNIDLKGWHPGRQSPPSSAAKRRQQANSLVGVDRLIYEILHSREINAVEFDYQGYGTCLIANSGLMEQANRLGFGGATPTGLGMFICGTGKLALGRKKKDNMSYYAFPRPSEMRQRWCEVFGPTDFPELQEGTDEDRWMRFGEMRTFG